MRDSSVVSSLLMVILETVPMKVILYTRPDCPLCDEALELVAPHAEVELVDIENRVDLLRRYGDRVPVLGLPDSGRELGWPFDATTLQAWLESS